MSIQITPVLCGMIQENAYIVSVEGRNDCAVIDPGDEYIKLKQALGGKKVGAILLTHGHFDHIMAAGEMAEEFGAPIYVHPADEEMLNDPTINGYTGLMGGTHMTGPTLIGTPYDREKLSVCGLDFTVLHTPGHSRGSVCLYLPETGALFSGDTLFEAGYGRLDLHGGSVSDMHDSLQALFALPGELQVWPGHGGPTTIARERVRYRL